MTKQLDSDYSNMLIAELLMTIGKVIDPQCHTDNFLWADGNNDFNRLRLRATQESEVDGWFIGEQFNERFDTEVGGRVLSVTLRKNEKGELVGGITVGLSLEQLGKHPSSPQPPHIVDYLTNRRYTLEEAQNIPELSAVAKRLADRIAEHDFRKHNKESWELAKRYKIERDRKNFKVFNILYTTRESRKFGFPIVNNLLSKSKEEQLTLAVRLLLHSVDINTALPEQFAVLPGTALHNDAADFLSLADANTKQDR